jgi:mannosyltransferase
MSSKTDASSDRGWQALLAGTLLVATGLRFVGLQSSLWYDEILTLVDSVRQPLHEILTSFPGIYAHPLYSLFAHASIAAFGESAWALRLPASVFGVATIGMVYLLGRRLLSRAEAWAGAAVLATSYHHVWFSQNARGYTLLGLLTLLTTHFLLRAEDRGHRRDVAGYVLTSALGIYTHLTMAFVVAGHALAILAVRLAGSPRHGLAPKRLLWAWAAIGGCSLLMYAPFLSSLTAFAAAGGAPQTTVNVATARWALVEAVRSLWSNAGVVPAAIGAALAIAGTLSLARRHMLATALLAMPAFTTAAALVVLGQPIRPRFFFFLSGPVAIFLGRGVGTLVERVAASRRAPTPAIVAVTLALVVATIPALPRNYRLPKQDFDGAVLFLSNAEVQGARIVVAGPACFPFERYYLKAWPCLQSAGDWQHSQGIDQRVLAVYTLDAYIQDPQLADRLRQNCPVVRRFSGTLGDGDITVCEANPGSSPRTRP